MHLLRRRGMGWAAMMSLLILTLAFAACGGDDDDDADGDSNGGETATEEQEPTTADDSATEADSSIGDPTEFDSDGEVDLTEQDRAIIALLEEHTIPEDMADGTFLGDPDAPITIEMYEDFQCPFCLRFSAGIEPGLVDEFVAEGTVRLHFRQLPILGPESELAALAGECVADQDRFWQYQNALFLTQARAGQGSDEQLNVGRFSAENLSLIAEDVGGIDIETFDACLAGEEHAEELSAARATAIEAGLTGTPGFIINGQPLVGGAPANLDGWRALLTGVLAQIEGDSGS